MATVAGASRNAEVGACTVRLNEAFMRGVKDRIEVLSS